MARQKKEPLNSIEFLELDTEKAKLLDGMIEEAIVVHYKQAALKLELKDIAARAEQELKLRGRDLLKLAKVEYEEKARKMDDETTAILDILEQLGRYEHNPSPAE